MGAGFLFWLLFTVAFPCACSSSYLDPDDVWKHIKARTNIELKDVARDVGALPPGGCDAMSENELREYLFDEDVMERWLAIHPEERRKGPPIDAAEKRRILRRLDRAGSSDTSNTLAKMPLDKLKGIEALLNQDSGDL